MPRTFFENKELREKRLDTIITTSLRLFATYGYKKVTIDMITKECRYSHGLFYHYFSSKAEVLKVIEKQSTKLFMDRFREISKKVPLGLEFLHSTLSVIISFINKGSKENYYVHLLFSNKLSQLNEGKKVTYLDKDVLNFFVESFAILTEKYPVITKELIKKYIIFFLTVVDGLSLSKINYPNLFKKNIDADVLFDRLLGFLKVNENIK